MQPAFPSSPVRMTAHAAQKLPRWTLWLLGLAYILPGLFGRDPWKTEDVISIGTMLTAFTGDWAQWILPESFGIAIAEGGPFLTWVGAGFMWLTSPILDPIIAARILQIICFFTTCCALWYGVFLLAKRSEMQPIPLPFGGQPSHKSYGRMLADAALLLFIATLGLVWKHHESSYLITLMAAHAIFFYGCARTIERPGTGLMFLTIALLVAFFSYGIPGVFPLLFAYLLIFLRKRPEFHFPKWWLLLPLATFAGTVSAWIILIQQTEYSGYWWSLWLDWNSAFFGLMEGKNLIFLVKNIPWFLWPSFPLTLYTLWRWRAYRHFIQLHIAGSLFFSAILFMLCSRSAGDAHGVALIIPCVILGAFALPVLKRNKLNALDWFAVMSFSFIILLIWFGWFAVMTGVPPKVAANFARQTVGFSFDFSWWTLIAGLLISASWIATVVWRLYSKPSELWRGTVLSATGIVVSWLLLTTFFLSAVDYGKSYRHVAADLATALSKESYRCIQGFGVGAAQRSSFAIFEGITLTHDSRCPLALVQARRDTAQQVLAQAPYANATILWQGHRASDRSERLILLRLAKNPSAR